MSKPSLDLSQLAFDRPATPAANPPGHRRRWLLRYGLPAGMLIGFFGLLGAAAGSQLLPRRAVDVVPVIVKRAARQPAGTPLFQAAGWIEPRPTPIAVPALAPGVVEQLLVVEGEQVEQGQPIARLIEADARLAVEEAQAALAIEMGKLQRAEASRRAAQTRRDQPLHLEVELADAERLLAKAQTELDQIPYRIEAAEAKWSYARRNLEGKQAARRSIAERVLQQAESDHAEAQATLHEWRQRQPNLRREVAALQKKVDALQQRLALLVEETRQLEEAEADVVAAEAFRDEAAARLRQAELRLERSVIRAPIAGRVLRLIAPPGSRVMGLDSQAEHRSSTVIEMYDPQRLQVRADVRLEDVPLVRSGQPVEIETASAEAAMQGRVLQSTSSANVQKNTLEVKIAVRDPPPTVRPEMLVTATFLATPTAAEPAAESSGRERLFVPRQLIQSAGSESFVWTVGPDHRVRRTPIVRGNAVQGGLVEVREGLQLTDKLIASGSDGIQPGMQVEIRGEDAALGIEGA